MNLDLIRERQTDSLNPEGLQKNIIRWFDVIRGPERLQPVRLLSSSQTQAKVEAAACEEARAGINVISGGPLM